MKPWVLLVMLAVASVFASPADTAPPASIFGKWMERFPNGGGMVTEFSTSSIVYYPVNK